MAFSNSTWILDLVLAAGLLLLLGSQLWTTILAARWRLRSRDRQFDDSYTPRASVIVPTKGLSPKLMDNFRALLTQDYPDYEVLFCVESMEDPGIAVIDPLVREFDHARLVVASMATTCSQQNANMLAGVKAASESVLLAFADNDIRPSPDWLRLLVRPLSDPTLYASSGYRWIVPQAGMLGEHIHSFHNMTMYTHFVGLNFLLGYGAWGGSFAVRHDDFVRLKIGDRWNETISDDMSLVGRLSEHGHKSWFVPECVSHTDEAIEQPWAAIGWYCRQVLVMRCCQFGVWWGGILPAAALGLVWWSLLPVGLVGMLVSDGWWWWHLVVAGLVFHVMDMSNSLLTGLLGPTRRHWLYVIRTPLLRLTQFIGIAGSLFTRSLLWARVRYSFDRHGRITKLERL